MRSKSFFSLSLYIGIASAVLFVWRIMKKRGWKNIIIDQMLKKGLDDEIANPNIETLAEIMAERDEAYKTYQKSGGHPVITHTNKGGAANLEKNPLLLE